MNCNTTHYRANSSSVPGDPTDAHVRRLEAIRRKLGGLERFEDGSWSVPSNFVQLALRYEEVRALERPVGLELLSALPLERLADHEGATWLDRELVSAGAFPRDCGFGREVRSALELRRSWLVGQGLADGIGLRPGTLELLERRELMQAAGVLSAETGLGFAPAEAGSRISGVVRRRLDLASGRFAMIDNGRDFSLVPWRPVLGRALGRRVEGTVRAGGGISWEIGRERGIEI